jgi:hypothetical protein
MEITVRLTFIMDIKLVPADDFQDLSNDTFRQGELWTQPTDGHTSSNVPNPPGRPINAPERFAISILRSCIELTTIWWVITKYISERRTASVRAQEVVVCTCGLSESAKNSRFPPVRAVGRRGTSQHSGAAHNIIPGSEDPRRRTSPLRFSSNSSATELDFGWPLPLSFSPPAARIAYGMIPVTLPPSKLATAPDTTPMMPLLPPPYTRGLFAATSACATAVWKIFFSHTTGRGLMKGTSVK